MADGIPTVAWAQRPITAARRKALLVSAQGSNDGLPGFPGWDATVDAATYAPVTVVDGEACSHCFYLTYHFRLTNDE